MTFDNLRLTLFHLRRAIRPDRRDRGEIEIERRLAALRQAPEPELNEGRARVLEAARMQSMLSKRGMERRSFTAPLFALSGATAVLAFAIGILVLFYGATPSAAVASTATVATLVSTQPAAITRPAGGAPLATSNPTPLPVSASPSSGLLAPSPAVVPEPTRDASLSATRTAPPASEH